ncbi:MAG TPA: PaaI family thioesterase [Azospirillum sp.]
MKDANQAAETESPLDFEFVGFNRLLGFRLAEWAPDHAVLEVTIRPDLLNRSGILHGGVVASMIDAAGGFCGSHTGPTGTGTPGTHRRVLTLSLTTSYVGQAAQGVIRATAKRRAGGRRIYVATVEVTDAEGRIIAVGEGTYRYRD